RALVTGNPSHVDGEWIDSGKDGMVASTRPAGEPLVSGLVPEPGRVRRRDRERRPARRFRGQPPIEDDDPLAAHAIVGWFDMGDAHARIRSDEPGKRARIFADERDFDRI